MENESTEKFNIKGNVKLQLNEKNIFYIKLSIRNAKYNLLTRLVHFGVRMQIMVYE